MPPAMHSPLPWMPPCHTCPLPCTPPHMPPTMHGPTSHVPATPPATHVPHCHARPPILRDAVNERAVRILLECILVVRFNFSPFHSEEMPALKVCLNVFHDDCTFDQSENFWSFENMGDFICSALDRK